MFVERKSDASTSSVSSNRSKEDDTAAVKQERVDRKEKREKKEKKEKKDKTLRREKTKREKKPTTSGESDEDLAKEEERLGAKLVNDRLQSLEEYEAKRLKEQKEKSYAFS
jgi:hypothetical protein